MNCSFFKKLYLFNDHSALILMSRALDEFSSLILQYNAEGNNSLQRFYGRAGCDIKTFLSLVRITVGISEVQFLAKSSPGMPVFIQAVGVPTVLQSLLSLILPG